MEPKIEECSVSQQQVKPEKLRLCLKQKASHGVGHILNDLVSSVWFTYLIIYLTKVVQLSNRHTGLVILLGQLADGIFTPFIGILCDRTVCQYGRRKLWHLIGSLLVTITFPLLLTRLLSHGEGEAAKVAYYVAVAAVFQFGWGCVQISHLSLIPEICEQSGERVELNAIRSAFTFLCGIFVYGVTWVLLGQSTESQLSPGLWKEFMYLSLIVIGTGNVFNVVFHVIVKEPPSSRLLEKLARKNRQHSENSTTNNECTTTNDHPQATYCNGGLELVESNHSNGPTTDMTSCVSMAESNNNTAKENEFEINERTVSTREGGTPVRERTRVEWLKDPALYKTALVYMCTRLVVNISQSYLPIYLTETLAFEKEAIAYFPLVVLVSGVLASLLVKLLSDRIGTKLTFLAGATAFIGACVWYYLQTVESRQAVYAATALMGSGSSVMLVTALSLISDLVGYDKKSGAFVYGAISFSDKVSSGTVIAIIQELNPAKGPQSQTVCHACAEYVRYVQSVAPGSAALVALVFVLFFYKSIFVCKKRVVVRDSAIQTDREILESTSAQYLNNGGSQLCACAVNDAVSKPCACVVENLSSNPRL
ncbi:major facilitator superfamily domain-containing protein 12 isoform X2 [Nematostella vectensis]|uniref:major facilitator superfamily domain-containing protein 12 isoform X2 n=1 Tax=Nematostella vectensis TaxID=45351 RepID=UPI002077878B|nr:major facilitator superfamily domain-containing protein 12 isoform X2 [Nematostella vectensis]